MCYSPWQLGVIFIVVPGLLLFPVCFELAIRLLNKKQINSSVFTMAIACPYYAIALHFWRKKYEKNEHDRHQSVAEEEFSTRVLEAEQELFREEDSASLGWQIVQLYRTFLLNLLAIFLTNPVYRSLVFGATILVFIVHDRARQPYKSQYLNHVQSLSSRCLSLILLCNVIPSMSFMVDVTSTLHIFLVAKMSSILELVFYALVPLSLPVWKVCMFLENRRNEKKREESIKMEKSS